MKMKNILGLIFFTLTFQPFLSQDMVDNSYQIEPIYAEDVIDSEDEVDYGFRDEEFDAVKPEDFLEAKKSSLNSVNKNSNKTFGEYLESIFSINNILIFGFFVFGVYMIMKSIEQKKKKEKQKELKRKKKYNKLEEVNKKESLRHNQLDILKGQVEDLDNIKVIDISEYKKFIIDNESKIAKEDNDKLYQLLKIDTFLNDFRSRILFEISGIKSMMDIEYFKKKVTSESEEEKKKIFSGKDDSAAELHRKMIEKLAVLEGEGNKGFDWNFRKMISLGGTMKETLIDQNKTLEFYKNIALIMVLFLINGKKLNFYEIYESFEKMGVFDSTWQKNVLNKLGKIEIGIMHINKSLIQLNDNFQMVIESTEKINENLKSLEVEIQNLKSSVDTGNLIQAISAYQVYRINKKL